MQIDNPDELPYYVLEGERPVRVWFTLLEAGDEDYINEWWKASIYFAVWQQVALHEVAQPTSLKLVVADEQETQILGLLRMGGGTSMQVTNGKRNTQSLLETAPRLRYASRQREYRGVGKVLVARLIAESIVRGKGGALIVTPRPQTYSFYRHLGFKPSSRDVNRFFVREGAGMQLLQSVLIGSQDK